MAPYAIQVTAATQWHGHLEEFSYVFHYDVFGTSMTDADWEKLGDAVVAAIRPLHRSTVTFIRYRIYGPTDQGKAANLMRYVKDISLAGTLASTVLIPRECVLVADVYVGRGPKGGKQYLRKFLHTGAIPGTGVTEDAQMGAAALPGASRTPIASALDGLKTVITSSGSYDICTPNGKHLPTGSNWSVNDYVHTRQFKRGRKERVT